MVDDTDYATSKPSDFSDLLTFANLPYGFQVRLTTLAPVDSLFTFARTGKLASKLASRRIRGVKRLHVFSDFDSPDLKIFHNDLLLTVSEVQHIYYVKKAVILTLSNVSEFEQVFSLIQGKFKKLFYYCTLPVEQAIQLISMPSLRYICVNTRIPITTHRERMKFENWIEKNEKAEFPKTIRLRESVQDKLMLSFCSPENPHFELF